MKREDLNRIINYNRFQRYQLVEMMEDNKKIGRDNQHLERAVAKLDAEFGILKAKRQNMGGNYVKRKYKDK